MTKDDRKFITELFHGLDGKIDGVDKRLSAEIHYQGVLLEDMRDDISVLKESHSFLVGLKDDVQQILQNTSDLPLIRKTVADHSLRLAKLEA